MVVQDRDPNLLCRRTGTIAVSEERPAIAGPATRRPMDADGVAHRAARAIELLEAIEADRGLLAELPDDVKIRLLTAAGKVCAPDRSDKERLWKALRRKRQRHRDAQRAADQRQLDTTGIRRQRLQLVYPTPLPEAPAASTSLQPQPATPVELIEPRDCYICKQPYRHVHAFYDALCPSCAEFNWHKRLQTADLSGRVALVTGARVKIGY